MFEARNVRCHSTAKATRCRAAVFPRLTRVGGEKANYDYLEALDSQKQPRGTRALLLHMEKDIGLPRTTRRKKGLPYQFDLENSVVPTTGTNCRCRT